jgi:hypothetical protein
MHLGLILTELQARRRIRITLSLRPFFHVRRLYYEIFADSRSCWIDLRSNPRRCAQRRGTEILPTGNHPGLFETFDDTS